MTADQSIPPKPVSEVVRPEITMLPSITTWRTFCRSVLINIARFLAWMLTQTNIIGLENYPTKGSLIVVSNHLGDADFVLGVAYTPRAMEYLVKSELYDFPIVGTLLRAYDVIWIHRGQPDRRAIRAGLQALEQGRAIALAPEGRESLSGALEEGTQGAAFLAQKSGAPVLPVTFTGTENQAVKMNIRRLRRTPITITVGTPFHIESSGDRKQSVQRGTQLIMTKLASQLPKKYRGVYQPDTEKPEDHA
jgi:1-acyl-sn-glycerol-3-phosphate acyltransferase